MPRKKTTVKAEDMTTAADKKAIAKATKDADKLAQRLITIDKKYGDGAPYEQTRIVDHVRFYLNHSAEAMLQAGRGLILLKEHEQHGDFMKSLEDIGLAPRTARQMMQAAVKFSDPKRQALAVLGKTKMIELMVEDDESLDELADGGTLANLDLDEIEKMSSRELKKALRKEREKREAENTANEKLIASKDKKINKLSKKHQSVDGQTKDFIRQLAETSTEIIDTLNRLRMLQEEFTFIDFDGKTGDELVAAREESYKLAGPYFHGAVRQIATTAAGLITDTDFIFNKYADQCMPDMESWVEALDNEA